MELDEGMLTVAEKWFGFHRGERLNVHIADGVIFVSECISAKKHGECLVLKVTMQKDWLYFTMLCTLYISHATSFIIL